LFVVRRSILIALVFVTAVLAGGAMASSARTPAKTAAILCPQATNPSIVPCCGPILATPQLSPFIAASGTTGVTGVTTPICCPCCGVNPTNIATFCCPPTAMCARPLSISSTPNPSPAGAAVTISGTIVSGGGSTVTLWQELPGQTSYRQIASTTAGSDNSYSFKLKAGSVTTDRSWYVANGSQQSATDDQLVQASVTAADIVERGGEVVITGQVRPAHAGEQVVVERRVGTQWSVVGKARLSKRSAYRVRVSVGRTGRKTLRVQLPGDTRNTDSFSRALSFTVS
jgi:hypothetical protein